MPRDSEHERVRVHGLNRRELLWNVGARFPMLALVDLLSRDGFFTRQAQASPAKGASNPLAAKPGHFPTKAKHVVFLFMNGAPSQVDTFDPKPALARHHGDPYKGDLAVGSNMCAIGNLMQSPFEFRKHGQSSNQKNSHGRTHSIGRQK